MLSSFIFDIMTDRKNKWYEKCVLEFLSGPPRESPSIHRREDYQYEKSDISGGDGGSHPSFLGYWGSIYWPGFFLSNSPLDDFKSCAHDLLAYLSSLKRRVSRRTIMWYLTISKFRAVFIFAVLFSRTPYIGNVILRFWPIIFRAVLTFTHLFCVKISAMRNFGIVSYVKMCKMWK